MDASSLIVDLVSGAIGGNAAGMTMPDKSLGTLGNTLAGIVGGGLGGQILQALVPAFAGGGSDLGGLLANIAGSGIGGGLLMVVVSLLKNALAPKT